MTLVLRTDRSLVRAAARSTRYLHVAFTAPVAPPRDSRRPLAISFVLDRSGSMAGQKVELARKAVLDAVRLLKPEDTFSVVVYDDRVDVVVTATLASSEALRLATNRLHEIDARGSTDLCTGWLRGCEQIAEMASSDTIARCLLLSDGLANQGTTDPGVLADRAARLRREYVVTSTFGVGADFDERLMASMAKSGGGNFYYIEHAQQIADFLRSELGEALEVVARRAAVELELPTGADAELLNDFRTETRAAAGGRRMRIELDDLASGQEISIIVKLRFPEADPGNRAPLRAAISSEDRQVSADAEIAWTFADHGANDRQPRDRQVDRLVAEIYAARARRDALERNRAGDFTGAAKLLRGTRERIASYAASDDALHAIACRLGENEEEFAIPMAPAAMKVWHREGTAHLRSRDRDGRARRTPKP